MAEKKNPALAILVGNMLSKSGMKKNSEAPAEESEESYDSPEEAGDQLQMIAEDMIAAVKAGDASALRDLLREAFECMEMEPHGEGPHLK